MARSIIITSPCADAAQAVAGTLAATGMAPFRAFGDGGAAPWDDYYTRGEDALTEVVDAYRAADATSDLVVAGGGAGAAAGTPALDLDAQLAAHTGAALVLVLDAAGAATADTLRVCVARARAHHAAPAAVVLVGATGTTGLDDVASCPVLAAPAAAQVDATALLAAVAAAPVPTTVTPLAFQAALVERARADRKTIVLPEPDDDRVLRAADEVLRRGIADLVLLGDEATVRARATGLGLDVSAARVVATDDPELLEKYATEFARLREKKGVTLEQARATVQDVSYFGTMMVHMGDADGMVSGAIHTTAHTIVPSFQVIKTKPGTKIVSSVFLMLMDDRVLVFGDCAVNPAPTAEELASIAVSSAATARAFGVDPKVAMLSYSTGTSGKGPAVDLVREATELVRATEPGLPVEGPIQFDAATDPAVAAVKAPTSPVAGQANVFVFPDLSAGNIGYKAVQRASGAVAVGPVLQGLNKPVNDLSRGALVEDIVSTVVITAVQAQG